MPYPANLNEKKLCAYDYVFLAWSSEAPSTPNHALRVATAKACAQGASPWDALITRDLQVQGFTDATSLVDVQNRMVGVLETIVASGG